MGKQRRRFAPTMHHRTFCGQIRWYNVETWCIYNIVTLPGQIGSSQKFATLAGGYYPLHYGVIAPGDHWILIRCGLHHPTRSVPLNDRAVIWWRTPCRGGYHPPGCFPHGKTTSALCADNAPPNILRSNSVVQCRNMVYLQHCYITGPNRFFSKICNVGGRILSVALWCDRPRRSLDFDSLRGAPPYTVCATE